MKRVIVQSLSSIILYVLMAMSIGSFTSGVYNSMSSYQNEGTLVFEMNALPWIALIVFGVVWSIYSYKTKSDHSLSFWQWSVRMTEFEETDERERFITKKSTKNGYTSFGISVPIMMMTFLFYPLFQDAFPTYPIYALASTLIISTLVYMTTWIRAYTQ